MRNEEHRRAVSELGFTVIDTVFSKEEVSAMTEIIEQADHSKTNFRNTNGLYAIRQFFKEIPAAILIVLKSPLMPLLKELFGEGYFIVKSIYFDKPDGSNWFVSYHQDLTISLKERIETDGFSHWSLKQNQYSVQPPLAVLEKNFTVRIHLDRTDENNGALRVIPGSHLKGIYRPETINWERETEAVCDVQEGGIMIMKPLLLHSSGKTTSISKRRVIHIEFSDQLLPGKLRWAELLA